MPDPGRLAITGSVREGGEPDQGHGAADIDPQFAHIRPRKRRKVTELVARVDEIKGESIEGTRLVSVPGHVYGIGEVISVRAGTRPGTRDGIRYIGIQYPGESATHSIELGDDCSLELHDPDGPKN